MSGGVDSSLAAKLTKDMGYECVGCMMRLYDSDEADNEHSRTCCSLYDSEDARSVAYRLGIPFYVFNFIEEFKKAVIDRFVNAYESGITPNPCIDCNRYMKFDKLYTRAKELGCNTIVTGHYARIEKENGHYLLKKGFDKAKDQSYFLYSLTQEQLAHTLFPLGNMRKSDVREIAAQNGFINAGKPDSQDICFVPDGDYAGFIERYTGNSINVGDFVDQNGNVLGKHKGIIHYTVGQRKGLGLSSQRPLYVCRLCPENGDVVLGTNESLFNTEADIRDLNWISGHTPRASIRCKVKMRYRQEEQWATVTPNSNGYAHISFDIPQRAISPGQAAVFYDGDVVLGGGTVIQV